MTSPRITSNASQTAYFFDVSLGWRGVCVEANPVYHAGIRAHRSCDLVPRCASNETHELNFVLPRNEGAGGLGGVDGGKLAKYAKRCPECKQALDGGPQKLTCVPMRSEFLRLGVSRVDLLSLDVEGHEEQVLKGIDLNEVLISHILCERNCERVLRHHGYTPCPTWQDAQRRKWVGYSEILWCAPGFAH